LTLVGIDHHESYLGLAGPDNDIASATDDRRRFVFVDLRDQRDMIFEIDVEKKRQLLLRETLLWREKASLQRLRAGSSDRREHLGSVIGTKRADFNRTTVAKMLDGRIVGGSRHEKWFPVCSKHKLVGRQCAPARENDLAVAMLDLDQARFAQATIGSECEWRFSQGASFRARSLRV
jgi:hypothetical protein